MAVSLSTAIAFSAGTGLGGVFVGNWKQAVGIMERHGSERVRYAEQNSAELAEWKESAL